MTPRKLKVFAEIASESKVAMQNQALHRFDGPEPRSNDLNSGRNTIPTNFPPASTPVRPTSDSTWDFASDQERQAEVDRVNEMGGEPVFPAGQRRGKNEAKSAWEKLRNVSPTYSSTSQSGAEDSMLVRDDKRSQEQRSFDEMLEKERMGEGQKEIWK